MTTVEVRARLRALAERSIGPVDDGYLRPWMCAGDPAMARVFLVGANPATRFPIDLIERADYLKALTANNDRLHALYLRVRDGKPSPTRINIERLVRTLTAAGVGTVLETNVWTFPTRSLAALQQADRTTVASSTILPSLIETLSPVALVVHGAEATRALQRVLGRTIETASRTQPILWHDGRPVIVSLPSLSPPPANGWLPKAGPALEALAARLAAIVGGPV
jgi:hypothetical protein